MTTTIESSPGNSRALAYDRGSPALDLVEDTIGSALARRAAQTPDAVALVDVPAQRRWTWFELHRVVDLVARNLIASGVQIGDRVALWAPNCWQWVVVHLAVARTGAVLVPVNYAYQAEELRFILDRSESTLLIAAQSFRSTDFVAVVESVAPQCPALQRSVILDTPAWESLLGSNPTASERDLAVRAELIAARETTMIQFTSGTTGEPKGVMLSHYGILNNARTIAALLEYTASDSVCVPVPFYHCFGVVGGTLACVASGAGIVIPAAAFDPRATLEAVAGERCTSVYGVPTMFTAELELDDFSEFDLTSLRTGVMSGAPCPRELLDHVVDTMGIGDIAIGYGMTETSPTATQTRPEDSLERRTTTVGRALPHVEIKVIDPRTAEIRRRGQVGEICIRGYNVMSGYWGRPDLTAEVVDPAGWMHTGDLGSMNDDGYLQITGRTKDVVIRGGENISPREIEEFLLTHPDVVEAYVVGVPDVKLGEELAVWLRLRPGAPELTHLDLREFSVGHIARHKVPRYVRITDAFPLTANGKVRKNVLRDMATNMSLTPHARTTPDDLDPRGQRSEQAP